MLKRVFFLWEEVGYPQIREMESDGMAIRALWNYTYIELVAANIIALDIGYETIVLPVLCLADGCPSSTILD